MTAYRIANWDRLYETAETRKIKRLAWVPTRNKHDGLGFRRMSREKDACELFTAWNLMLQVASKGEAGERGTLARGGVALTPDDLQMMTGFPSRIFQRGMEFFSSHNIGWLEKMRGISGEHPETSGDHPDVILLKEGTEGSEGTEENRRKSVAVAPVWTCPETLNTDRFRKAFDNFIIHRAQKRQRMTAIAIAGQLGKLEKWGEARAVAAIEHSIAEGYTGIYEARGDNGGSHGSEADRRRSEKLGRECAEPSRPPPVIKL